MLGKQDMKKIGADLPWPDNFYTVTDQKTRRELLEQAIASEGETDANHLRLILWDKRYPKTKGSQELDAYIRFWMDMCYVSKNCQSFFNKKTAMKVAKTGMKEVGFDLSEVHSEVGQEVFYKELRHVVRLYLRICTEDRRYTSNLMGLVTMKDEKLIAKITNEVYRVAVKTPKKINLEGELTLFTQAALDAFYTDFPDQRPLMEELISKGE